MRPVQSDAFDKAIVRFNYSWDESRVFLVPQGSITVANFSSENTFHIVLPKWIDGG
jgi:hypothetical protein